MLWQPSLPKLYRSMTSDALAEAIADRRKRLGNRLIILGHHYQVDPVIRHADFTGDSLKLSQIAAEEARKQGAEFIIFCGVHFMAETADMLTDESVRVILPDMSAGCSMADMADYDDTVHAWDVLHEAMRLERGGEWNGRIVPITYVNSTAAIKAFVGDHGGVCCTSSNAAETFAWAMAGGETPRAEGEEIKVLFLPDQHLGRNTAAAFGIDTEASTCVYDPKLERRGEPFGGAVTKAGPGGGTGLEGSEAIAASEVILWAGHCSVHKLFRPEHCAEIHAANVKLGANEEPMRIIVHPECSKEVVDLADESGSTGQIIALLREAREGSRWAIGTEHNLVARMCRELAERGVEARILSDCQCMCTTMYRIDEPHLLWVLDGLCGLGPTSLDDPEGGAYPSEAAVDVRNVVSVPAEVRTPAVVALDRMLSLKPAGEATHGSAPN